MRPSPHAAALAGLCTAKVTLDVLTAQQAKREGKCVKIKFGFGYPDAPMQRYSGGYCT